MMLKKLKLYMELALLVILILVFICIPSYGYLNESDPIIEILESATEYDYPPFSVTDNGTAGGFSVELLKAVANEVGYDIHFKIDEWQTIKEELETSKLDVLPLVGYSIEREDVFDFTVPYIVMRGNIFVRKGEDLIKSEEDLKDKAILVMAGDNSEEYARRMGFTDNLILASTYVEAFRMLNDGQYDAVLAQGLVGEKIIKDYEFNNLESVFHYTDDGHKVKVQLKGYEQKFCFAVPEGEKALLAKLNEGLAIVSENGTYDALYQKWFPFLVDDTPSLIETFKYLMLAMVPTVIFILVLSNLSIKKRVSLKTRQLNQTSQKLEFERDKYYKTIYSIGDGVVVVNSLGLIDIINTAACEILGVDESVIKVHYKSIFDFYVDHDDLKPVDPIKVAIEKYEILKLKQTDHMTVVLGEDKGKYLEIRVTPIFNQDNNLSGTVAVVRDISIEKEQYKKIEYLSFHDSLTGLYNRRYFEEEMKRLDVNRNYPIAIVMADVNGLKLINDAFGHLVGDDMLVKSSDVLREVSREGDIISRWGGDEFVIIYPKTSRDEVEKIIKRLKHKLLETHEIYGNLSISFGYSVKSEENESLLETLKTAENNMYKEKMSESAGVHGETIRTIINTLFEKSPRDKEHCERVSKLGESLARHLGLDASKVSEIKMTGLLHDIGKIIIPQAILDKEEKLTDEEFEEIHKHPSIGYRMLSTTNEFAHIADGVLYHHERIDGSGYPNALKGDQIPLEAKIISIVDAYDAMTAERPYRHHIMTKEEAAKELLKHGGTQFDEDIVGVFIKKVLNLNVKNL